MTCQSFSNRNTRGVTAFPPKKKSRPEIKILGQVMEKEMCHRFISQLLLQGRGCAPSKDNLYKPRVYKTLGTQEYTFQTLFWLLRDFIFRLLVPLYLVKLNNFSSSDPILLI
jgi:hypothetical protein